MPYLIGALVLFATVLGPARSESAVPVIPFTKFSEASNSTVSLVSLVGACRTAQGEGEVYVSAFKSSEVAGNDAFQFWYAPATGRIVFAHYAKWGDENSPDMLGHGIVDLKTPGAHDLVPRLAWRPYDQAQDADGPCQFLFPNTVSL